MIDARTLKNFPVFVVYRPEDACVLGVFTAEACALEFQRGLTGGGSDTQIFEHRLDEEVE